MANTPNPQHVVAAKFGALGAQSALLELLWQGIAYPDEQTLAFSARVVGRQNSISGAGFQSKNASTSSSALGHGFLLWHAYQYPASIKSPHLLK